MEKEKIFACKEHIEMAIDDFVNKVEAAPEIKKTNNEKCSYCEGNAEYKIIS